MGIFDKTQSEACINDGLINHTQIEPHITLTIDKPRTLVIFQVKRISAPKIRVTLTWPCGDVAIGATPCRGIQVDNGCRSLPAKSQARDDGAEDIGFVNVLVHPSLPSIIF
jgi:hypothetical protein